MFPAVLSTDDGDLLRSVGSPNSSISLQEPYMRLEAPPSLVEEDEEGIIFLVFGLAECLPSQ